LQVTVAGLLSEKAVHCSRKMVMVPDVALDSVRDAKFDAIVLPGGQPGSNSLAEVIKGGKSEIYGVLYM
jgi:protein DJ-1